MISELPILLVIPTGIGCEVGGYSGDSIPAARLLAGASGCLITHPNAMNGAALYWNDARIQYVEGYSLDRFASGELCLRPVRQQKVGLLLDSGIDGELRQRHLQVAEGCRAILGLDIGPIVMTKRPIKIQCHEGSSGSSWGTLAEVDILLEAGKKLKNAGATAIAVVTRFPDDVDEDALEKYRQGKGVDLLAGAEAVISHLLVRHLSIPCAHAPALSSLPINEKLDSRAVGEELAYTFLQCVLVGLSRAPDLLPVTKDLSPTNMQITECLHVDQLGAVVAPDGALGGQAVLACLERKIPLIVVSNPNVLNVTLSSLAGKNEELLKQNNLLFYASNYIEAAGVVLLLREGINFDSLCRPISRIHQIT